ncbi:MAG TPA: multiheme c-type cytochrome [Polyangiaceae bacterium]|nr:multiheme c-type cytochrome [Polyangiaceae bacterium]
MIARGSIPLVFTALFAMSACTPSPRATEQGSAPQTPVPTTSPASPPGPSRDLASTLPVAPPAFAPSHLQIEGGAAIAGSALTDIDTCDNCHADIAAQWRSSAHSIASFNNPVYRFAVDRFRSEVNNEKSRFCGGCHDIALMVDGAMDAAVEPTDKRAHAGITCRTCHSIAHARPDGNGSYTLTADPIPTPTLGDSDSIKRHVERSALPALRTAGLCVSCHRSFLNETTGNPHHMTGQDDATPFQRSVFAGSRIHRVDDPVAEQDCRGCHMPLEEAPLGDAAATQGKVASHRFLGAHTWLAAMRGDKEQLRKTEEMLRGSVSIDVAAAIFADGSRALPADGARITPGERVVLDVVLRSLRVGHRFPGGVMDAQDTWVEVTVQDARGKRVAEAGTQHERSGADPSAHRLRSLVAGDDGMPLLERQTHLFRAAVFNHTLAPRDAAVVELAFDVPPGLKREALPLQVRARLRHRTRNLEVWRAACADAKAERGRAFRKFAARSDLDPCAPQPVTDIAEAEVWLGAGWEARQKGPARPAWRRLFEHGLGLLGALQERLDEARPSLLRALEEVSASGTDLEKAMVLAALADVAARQGRVDEALEWAARAEPLVPGHPALAHIRGKALSLVWRWPEAALALAPAADAAKGDDYGWIALAIARGSAGDAGGSLEAATRGLSVQPRDHDLLRVQALALEKLEAPESRVSAAFDAWRAVQIADEIPRVKARCSAKVAGCANERSPVHTHALRPAR